MNTILSIRIVIFFVFFSMATQAVPRDLSLIEKWGDNLLEPVQIEDEKNILSGGKRHLIGIEEVEYVQGLVNCTSQIKISVEKWKKNLKLISRYQEQNDSEIVVEINTAEPIKGSMFIIYRFVKNERYAYLKFLFDSNKRIDPTQQGKIVRTYNMVSLKDMLIKAMECG